MKKLLLPLMVLPALIAQCTFPSEGSSEQTAGKPIGGSTTAVAGPPTVLATTPAAGATNVAVGNTITISFSEPMDTNTITMQSTDGTCMAGSLRIQYNTSCLGSNSLAYNAAKNFLTIALSANLQIATTYTIQLDTTVKDSTSEALAANFTATFNTAPPGLPANVRAFYGNAKAVVGFDAVAGASTYTIYNQGTPGVTDASNAITSITSIPHVITGLTNGATLYLRVAAEKNGVKGGLSPEISVTPRANRTIFVTSSTHTGNLGGINGARTTCKDLATPVMPSRNFQPYLSDSLNDAACLVIGLSGKRSTNCGLSYNIDDVQVHIGPFVNRNPTPATVQANLLRLVFGRTSSDFSGDTCISGGTALTEAIGYSESSNPVSGQVFTGSRCGISYGSSSCGDFMADSANEVTVGDASNNTHYWSTTESPGQCNSSGRLYCFEN